MSDQFVQSAVVVFDSALRGEDTHNSAEFENLFGRGVALFLDLTAEGGTATIDVKLQVRDPVGGDWIDFPGAAYAQKSATGTHLLMIYPGIAETANVAISTHLPRKWRAVAVIAGSGTPTFTFSLAGYYLP
jgi:hypothetical protein